MISVTLYRGMKKDYNSTKLPADDGTIQSLATFDCAIHEPCSVQTPTIIIAAAMTYDMVTFNYAYIPAFHRYYWINDISWNDGRWWLAMSCDVLATYKTDIGASSQYVIRSQSEYDEQITDTAYVPVGGKQSVSVDLYGAGVLNPPRISQGTYILGIAGKPSDDTAMVGSTQYIMMSQSQLNSFIALLLADTPSWMDIDTVDMSEATAKLIINPLQYIQSCRWYPMEWHALSPSQVENGLNIGWWTIAAASYEYAWWEDPSDVPSGHIVSQATPTFRMQLSAQYGAEASPWKHPQISRGAYLNRAPYSTYQLYIPTIGYIEIPPDRLWGNDNNRLFVDLAIDIPTGDTLISIYALNAAATPQVRDYITVTRGKIGVDIPLTQITTDIIGAAKSAASGVAGALGSLLTFDIGGAISSAANAAIDTAIKTATPLPSFLGNAGSFSDYDYNSDKAKLTAVHQLITDDATPLIGRPLCKMRVINTLSGYILCGNPHVAIAGATAQEVQQIEQFMREGFRYE